MSWWGEAAPSGWQLPSCVGAEGCWGSVLCFHHAERMLHFLLIESSSICSCLSALMGCVLCAAALVIHNLKGQNVQNGFLKGSSLAYLESIACGILKVHFVNLLWNTKPAVLLARCGYQILMISPCCAQSHKNISCYYFSTLYREYLHLPLLTVTRGCGWSPSFVTQVHEVGVSALGIWSPGSSEEQLMYTWCSGNDNWWAEL